jgi:hypothetical protein
MRKFLKAVQYKFLFFITYYEISFGRWKWMYGRYSKNERKAITNKLINDYLNEVDL